ncbi:tyrosine-type recombinase/integrase [Petrimonas sp.]|uniref:tyrosine-type recombinase/integrase n=1 Tax=Petrimonas sp. TaxID=2023866 RepID=UPI003F51A8A9
MEYTSALSGYITGLIEQKHSVGYKYNCEAAVLKRFDIFCGTHYPELKVLDKEIVLHWSKQRSGEHPSTLQNRITPVRDLAKYIINNGCQAYILPKGVIPKSPRHLPYIYSDSEIKNIFSCIDKCRYCTEVPYRHLVMPLFFRLLYCCGLRLSEARLIKVKDVDVENGVITLFNTKFDRHRQVPLSEKFHERLRIYYEKVHILSNPDDWFFPGYNNKPMTLSNVYKNHRKFIWQAGISHSGRSRPGERGAACIQSFRHTFASHCLRNWISEGKNVQAYLPVLQSYMGHVSYKDTAYYLHLTTDLFPDIMLRLGNELGDIVPEINYPKDEDYEGSY